jgi:hypothetical protein
MVLTNYRLLYVPKITLKLKQYFNAQPKFVKEFFNIPLGFINRCERYISVTNEI